MAGGPGDPTALLRVYLRHGKLLEAASLARTFLSAWLLEVRAALSQCHDCFSMPQHRLAESWPARGPVRGCCAEGRQRVSLQVSDLDRQHAMGTWFPHGLFDILQDALTRSAAPKLRNLGAALARDRCKLAELVSQQSDIMTSGRDSSLEAKGRRDAPGSGPQPMALQL